MKKITPLVAELVVPGHRAMIVGHVYQVEDELAQTLIDRAQAVIAQPGASGEKTENLAKEEKILDDGATALRSAKPVKNKNTK